MFYERLRVTECINCGVCYPSQWDAKAVDGNGFVYELYLRYRSHRFSVEIIKTENKEVVDYIEKGIIAKYLIYTYIPMLPEESTMTDKELHDFSEHILDWSDVPI